MTAPPGRVSVFVREPWKPDSLGLSTAISGHMVRPVLTNALWENLLLPRAAREVDILFGPSFTLPLTFRGPSVVAIHGVDEASKGYFPWWHSLTYEQKYRLSARKADRVIVNSHYVGTKVRDLYGIPQEKIEVIWLGADGAFRRIDDDALLRETRRTYLGADAPFILFMGGLSSRRNVPMLLTAFSILKKRDKIPHFLLLMGPNRANLPLAELATQLGISDSLVHTVGEVARHSDLAAVYNAADLFVLPSSSEGFSLTLAEALACGTPVVTVNRAALGEVAHGYARTVEEPTVESLTEAMSEVLSSPQLQQELRAKGQERARELRWDVAARRTWDVLERVAKA